MASRLGEIVARLQKPGEWEHAMLDLYELEPTKRDLPDLYWALSQTYPDDQCADAKTRCTLFIKLGRVHDATTVDFIEKIWPSLPVHGKTRDCALGAFSEINSQDALRSLSRILVREQPKLWMQDDSLFWPIVAGPQNAGVMFPDLLSLLSNKAYRQGVYKVAAAASRAGAVKAESLKLAHERVLGDLREAQRLYARTPRESTEYPGMVQYVAAVLRVMAAFAEDPDLGRLVRVAVQHENAQIAFAAYCACKEVGWKTSPDPIDRFAADSSTRLDLFEELQRRGEEDQFPRAYWTQSSFAEGDMVRWLMRSITFARPPQSIKLVETRIVSPMGKKGRIYVYKFKYPWKERGWIIGLSGPQPLNSSEMVTAGTGTSSAGRSERDTSIEELLEFLEEEMLRKPVELKRSEAKSHR